MMAIHTVTQEPLLNKGTIVPGRVVRITGWVLRFVSNIRNSTKIKGTLAPQGIEPHKYQCSEHSWRAIRRNPSLKVEQTSAKREMSGVEALFV